MSLASCIGLHPRLLRGLRPKSRPYGYAGVVVHRSFAAALSTSVYSFFVPWTLVKRGVEREVMTPIGAPPKFREQWRREK